MSRMGFLFRNLFRRRAANRDLDAELEAYAAELRDRQAPPPPVEQIREEVRSARVGAGLESWARDARLAARRLRHAPGLTLACALTFALGIGANTVVFSIANDLMFRQLPVDAPGQLCLVLIQAKGSRIQADRSGLFRALRQQGGAIFQGLGEATLQQVGIGAEGAARTAWISYVSGNFFALMRIKPALGGFFTDRRAPEIVLGYSYWRSRFGGDPAVIGREATVDGHGVTIVGVAPRGFTGFSNLVDAQAYVPIGLETATGDDGYITIGRLRAGVTRAQASPLAKVMARRLEQEYPDADRRLRMQILPLTNEAFFGRGSGPNPLPILAALFLSLAGAVLLLAAANLVGILLARASAQRRELAVRAALGASGGRLARQVFLETLWLAALGAAVGLAFGVAADRWISSASPTVRLPLVLEFGFDWRVFAYSASLALIVAVATGVAPALQVARARPGDALRGQPGGGNPVRQRLRSILVAGQVAGSLALLTAGGLFARSLARQSRTELGFEPNHVWTFALDASGAGYDAARGQQAFAALLPRVRALTGVASASLAITVPFDDEFDASVQLGRKASASPDRIEASYDAVTPGYLASLGVPLLAGRRFTAADTAASPPVAIVSASLAHSLWPGQNPIGRTFATFTLASVPDNPLRVVGVAGDVRTSLSTTWRPQFYRPLAQLYNARQILVVRAARNPVREVERAIAARDPDLPFGEVQTMNTAINGVNGLFLLRLGTGLAAGLGLLALLLAVVGVYGVVAYVAAQRTHEFGVRTALGAGPRQLIVAVLRQALPTVSAGLALGLLFAAALGKVVGAFLVGVSGLDPLTYFAAASLLAAASLAASLIPALRAARADPLDALRCE